MSAVFFIGLCIYSGLSPLYDEKDLQGYNKDRAAFLSKERRPCPGKEAHSPTIWASLLEGKEEGMTSADPLQELLLRVMMTIPPDILIMDLVLLWELVYCFWRYARHFHRSWLIFLWEIHIFWAVILAAKATDMLPLGTTAVQLLLATGIVFSTWCFRWVDNMLGHMGRHR